MYMMNITPIYFPLGTGARTIIHTHTLDWTRTNIWHFFKKITPILLLLSTPSHPTAISFFMIFH